MAGGSTAQSPCPFSRLGQTVFCPEQPAKATTFTAGVVERERFPADRSGRLDWRDRLNYTRRLTFR